VSISTFSGKNLQSLKQELELDVHRVPIDELCKRFNTNLERGLTKSAALEGNKKYGLNALTPPPTTPGACPN
jgi:sodium/potassium-transporting ATPase subunit alpha